MWWQDRISNTSNKHKTSIRSTRLDASSQVLLGQFGRGHEKIIHLLMGLPYTDMKTIVSCRCLDDGPSPEMIIRLQYYTTQNLSRWPTPTKILWDVSRKKSSRSIYPETPSLCLMQFLYLFRIPYFCS